MIFEHRSSHFYSYPQIFVLSYFPDIEVFSFPSLMTSLLLIASPQLTIIWKFSFPHLTSYYVQQVV